MVRPPATHDAIRCRSGAFERATGAVRRYAVMGITVKVATSLNQINRRELTVMVQLARDLGVAGFDVPGLCRSF